MIFNSKLKKRKLISFSAVFLVLAGGLVWKLEVNQNKKKDLSSFTTFAESGSLPGLITVSGELASEKSVNISPNKQGILLEIYVDSGDKVIKGQLIAKMRNNDILYRLNELRADYEKNEANYNRRKSLYKEGAISRESYEQYKNLFITSEARLKQLEIEKNELKILAPFEGIITNRFAVPGSFVTPTTAARTSTEGGGSSSSIVELSQGLEIIAKVPESDIGRIALGQDADIRVDAFPDKRFKATVKEISPRAIRNNNVTSFEVTLSLISTQTPLRIGMTADIEFKTGKTSINTLVPTVAIVTRNGVPGLLLVGEKNQPEFTKIELGPSSGSQTSVLKGVNPGDQIFIDLPPWAKQRKKQ